jgi:hypothetical protein
MAATRAWAWLVVLSAASTAMALGGQSGRIVSLIILALAWAKAQVILNRYLGLAAAPAWGRGFALSIGGYMILAMALVVAAAG